MENWFCKAEPNCCLDGPLGTKINLTYAADMGNTWCYSGFPEYANMSMVSKSEPATATTLMGSPVPFATNFVPSIPMTINNVSFANPTNYSYYDYKSGNVQPTGFDYQSGYVQPTGVPVPNFAESGQSKPSRPVPAPFTGPKCWISVGDRLEKAKALGDGLRCVTYNMLNANDGKMYYTASQISNATAVAMARFPRFFKDLAYCSGDYCNGLECISGDSKNNTKRGYPLGSYCVSYTSATNSAMYGGATKAEYDAMVANPTVYKNLKSCQTNNCIDPV